MVETTRGLFVGNADTAGHAEPLRVINPATGGVIAEVACADEADVDAAVRVADDAFRSGVWSGLSPHERARVLHRFADGIEARMPELWRLETLNNGRPVTETRAQITRLPEWYRYNAALLLADRSSVVPMAGDYHSYTSRFPLGIVAILASFNHPLMIPSKSLAPALATGNSVVLKPSEQTPLTALLLAEIAAEAGLAPGVLNVVPGLGPVAGAALAGRRIGAAKIVFTGGTEAGRSIAVAAAGRFADAAGRARRQDTPVLVFADSPPTAARARCRLRRVRGVRQASVGSRILVQAEIHDAFVDELVAIARGIRIGDPADEQTQLGPVISARHASGSSPTSISASRKEPG